MTADNKTYHETFEKAVEESQPSDYSLLSREEVYTKLLETRNNEESLRVKEICERLNDFNAYYDKYSVDENKYPVLEGLIVAIYHDVSNRLCELSGITTCPKITEKDLENFELRVHRTLQLKLALEKTMVELGEMRQIRESLR
jgi:hypothetical protein